MPKHALLSALAMLPLCAASPLFAAQPVAAPSQAAPAVDSVPMLTPSGLHDALNNASHNTDDLAAQVRVLFGKGDLTKGGKLKTEDRPGVFALAWAIEAPGLKAGEEPQVVAEDGTFTLRLQKVGTSDIYAGVAYRPEGIAMKWYYDVHGAKVGGGQYEGYPRPLEEYVDPNVPKGVLTQMPPFHSTVFDGTSRNWWVYVPANYSADKPPALMVFQDGAGPKGWIPAEFDNMIAKGEIPPTVGVFIDPGKFADGKSNRSPEYDTVSDAYSKFLLEEVLPEVEKTTKVSHDPAMRAISGVSSGAICAFTVAWNHPDQFSKVITCVGSFTALQGGPTGVAGGNTYPAIIRKSRGRDMKEPPKPIHVFMTDGVHDIDNLFGNWPLANLEVDSALTFAGIDHKLVRGNGFHGGAYGRFKNPEALRWIWRKPDAAAQ